MKARDFKRFSATNVGAGELVVPPNHIRLSLCKFGTVALVGVAGELWTFAANDPGHFVFAGLAALGTDKVVGACFGGLVEKIAFFHLAATPLSEEAPPAENSPTEPREMKPDTFTLAGLFHSNPLRRANGLTGEMR